MRIGNLSSSVFIWRYFPPQAESAGQSEPSQLPNSFAPPPHDIEKKGGRELTLQVGIELIVEQEVVQHGLSLPSLPPDALDGSSVLLELPTVPPARGHALRIRVVGLLPLTSLSLLDGTESDEVVAGARTDGGGGVGGGERGRRWGTSGVGGKGGKLSFFTLLLELELLHLWCKARQLLLG